MTPPGATLPKTALPAGLAGPAPTPLPPLSDPFDEMNAGQPTVPADAAIKEEPTTLDQLRRFATGGYLYALMDSTDQILVPYQAKQLGPTKAMSLFSGTAKEQYWQVAPYLFHVDPALLDWIIAKLWKEPWGIFVITKAKFEDLRVHLKKFLLAQLPDGKVWYFRYYDPRILKAYLPVCDLWELQKFFGPVRAFAIAGGEQEKPTMVQGLNVPPHQPSVQLEATVWWRIRSEHRVAFKKAALDNFIGRVAEHVQKVFPEQCEKLGQEGVRIKIAHCIKQAATYGIVNEPDVSNYIDLAFAFGRNFDGDDKQAWAGRILRSDKASASSKVHQLLAAVRRIAAGEGY